jgi:restriction system protein
LAIPGFQDVMLPLLQLMSDGRTYSNMELIEPLAIHFALTADEQAEMIPSGKVTTFQSRVAWARTYLFQAGLLERVSRGQYRISASGRELLDSNPSRISIRTLQQYPEFRQFQNRTSSSAKPRETSADDANSSPQELMAAGYAELRQQVVQSLLQETKQTSPAFFERLVVDLLVAMGYGGSRADAGQAVGGSGDGGIDGIIKEDRLGLDAVYVQAKRWENVVGRPTVQAFAGSLEGHRARKGVMITTSSFSREAQEYVGMIEKRIVLIDGEQLAQLMIDHGIGVSIEEVFTIYRVDYDYFLEE